MPAARFKSASRVVAEVAARRWPPGGVEIFTLGGFDARSAQCTATTVIPTGGLLCSPVLVQLALFLGDSTFAVGSKPR